MRLNRRFLGFAALVASLQIISAGDVTGKITLKGTPPPEKDIPMDPACGKLHPTKKTKLYVVGAGGELADTFVYVKDGLTGKEFPVPEKPNLIDQVGCEYVPYVSGLMTGQKLLVRNSDPLLHNVRSNAVINQAFNKSTPIEGMKFDHVFATKEVMVPFKCDVHGWMSAYVGVLDHPYFGTTAADGTVVIANLPPGTYTIEAWHEQLGTRTQQVTIGAKESRDVSFSFAR